MTQFKFGVFRIGDFHGSNTVSHSLEDDIFICTIQWVSLNLFWRRRPRMVKNNLMVLKRMHEVGYEVLILVEVLTNLGYFPLIG